MHGSTTPERRGAAPLPLPGGATLLVDPEAPRVVLAPGAAGGARALERRLSRLPARRFVLPEVASTPDGVELAFPGASSGLVPLEAFAAERRAEPDGPALALALSGALLEAAALAEAAGERLLLAPALVAVEAGATFRVLAVPCAAASLADWANAAPPAAAWTAPERLVTPGPAQGPFAAGAALHGWFVERGGTIAVDGELELARRLRGCVGSPARLREGVADALPRELGDEASALVELVLELLGPSAGRPGADAARARLAALAERLRPRRLVARLEHEGRAPEALELARRWAPADAELWAVAARLERDRGRPADALAAALRGAGHDRDARDLALRVALRLDLADDAARAAALAACEPLAAALDADDEDGVLALAVLLARLGRTDAAHALVAATGASPWREARRAAVRARLLAGEGRWAEVSAAVKAAAASVRAAPGDGAGDLAAAVDAGLHLLDGVAHVEGHVTYAEPLYLVAAFERLAVAFERATAARRLDLAGQARRWVAWVRARAAGSHPSFGPLRLGADAFLAALGGADATPPRQAPPLPDHDLDTLAPRLGPWRRGATEEP